MKLKRTVILILILIGSNACGLPAGGGVSSASQSVTPTPYGPSGAGQESQTASGALSNVSLPPADLPFNIDCSALDPSRQATCDDFIANTRDLVYPLLRELTGTSLSGCYEAVYYTILPSNPMPGAVGIAENNHISMSQEATLDTAPLYDAHELLHAINFCSTALDYHVFHGPFENYVDRYLVGRERFGRESAMELLNYAMVEVGTITEPGLLVDPCRGILANLTTVLYYDLGIEAVKQLYQATINPGFALATNERLYTLYGPQGNKFKALVNTLEQEFNYPLDVPECGY